MKNYMKKTIVGIFSFILLFSAQSAFAATWNGASNDCPDINIANYTTNDGYGSPCWDGTSINASEGDVINVKVYYHNTSSTTATNTRLKIFAPSGSSARHSFSAQILSDQGNLYTDSVTVSIPSSQTLTLLSTKWYPNQSGSSSSLLNGQSSSAVTSSSGLSIGSIAPGWETQGTINVAFKVSSTVVVPEEVCEDTSATNYGGSLLCTYAPKICTISNFSASDYAITQGDYSTLSWNTTNCTSATLNPTVGSVNTSGSKAVNPSYTTLYTLTAYGTSGTKTQTLTVNVSAKPIVVPEKICTVSDFSASPTSITSGSSSILSWYTSSCESVNISQVGSLNAIGSKVVYPTTTTTYTLTARSFTGALQTRNATVNVTTVSPPKICTISNFSASDYAITQGDYSTLSWNTTNCTSATLNPTVGSVSTSGSKSVNPSYTTTYTLSASGTSGTKTQTVTVNVSAKPIIPTATMSGILEPSSSSCTIKSGGNSCSLPFSWSTQNPVGTSAVTHDEITIATGNNGSKTFTIEGGSAQTYYLYNNGVRLDYETVRAECAYGLAWTGSYCAPIYVEPVQELCKDTSATNYGGALPCTYAPKICKIEDFSATKTSITSGSASSLSWYTTNCTSVNLDYTNVTTTGSKTVYPTTTKTYTLRGSGVSSSDVASVTINVSANPPTPTMSGNLNASDDSCVINSGSSTCSIPFSWSTTNPVSTSSVTHDGDTLATGNNGSKTFSIKNGSQRYYLYNNGIELDSETVTASCALGSGWNGSYCSPNVVPKDCSINNFYTSATSITSGGHSVLSWETNNCTSVTIYPTVGEASLSGTRTVSPTASTTYTLNAYGTSGNPQTRTLIIEVEQTQNICKDTSATNYGQASTCTYPNLLCREISALNYLGTLPCKYQESSYNKCTISDFSVNDSSIEDGDSTTLFWQTNNCDNVRISDVGYVNDYGNKKVSPDEDITYILTAYGKDGSLVTDSLRVYVDGDDDDDNDNDCSIDSFSASDTYIDKGDYSTLKWKTTDCDDVTLSNIGDVDLDGDEKVYPSSTTTYTLKAYGENGNKTKTIRINVGNDSTAQIYNTNVVTTIATNISQTGAQVNGLVTSSNYSNANVYFEYGTTMNLGMRTASRSTNSNSNFSDYITNLSPRTIYYFQAISEGTNGVSKGAIEVFQTLGATPVVRNYTNNTDTNTVVRTVREVVVQGETVYGSTSPLILEITNRYQSIGKGDLIDYTVYYKNISNSRLDNPMVQVYVPRGITITNVSAGTYSEDERTLSVPINDLLPQEEGRIYLQARVDTLNIDLAQVVTTAILVYTNPNGAQENAMAYVLNNPRINNSNLLGASAFFGGIFNFGLIGWLILIILIMLIVLIARSYRNRNIVTTKTEKTVSH